MYDFASRANNFFLFDFFFISTNLPEQLMEFPGFSMPPDSNRSFVPWEKISNYLRNFADNFDLKKSIKFRHHVIRVRPIETTRWEVSLFDA